VIGEGEDTEYFPAHRIILAARSPVFAAMLYGSFSESRDTEIPLPDVNAKTFHSLLQAIYSDNLKLTNVESAWEMLSLSSQFGVSSAKNTAAAYLANQLSISNACKTLEEAPSALLEDAPFVIDFIEKNALAVFKHESFLRLSMPAIISILKSEKLNINEVELAKRLLKWGSNSLVTKSQPVNPEKLATQLREITPFIRFPLFDPAYFTDFMSRAPLLDIEEQLQIYCFIGLEPEERGEWKGEWKAKPRGSDEPPFELKWSRVSSVFLLSTPKTVIYQGGSVMGVATTPFPLPSGKYHVRFTHSGGFRYSIGICNSKHSLNTGLGTNEDSWALDCNGRVLHRNSPRQYCPTTGLSNIEVSLDLTSNTLRFRTSPNGSSWRDHGSAFDLPPGQQYALAVSMDYQSTAEIITKFP